MPLLERRRDLKKLDYLPKEDGMAVPGVYLQYNTNSLSTEPSPLPANRLDLQHKRHPSCLLALSSASPLRGIEGADYPTTCGRFRLPSSPPRRSIAMHGARVQERQSGRPAFLATGEQEEGLSSLLLRKQQRLRPTCLPVVILPPRDIVSLLYGPSLATKFATDCYS